MQDYALTDCMTFNGFMLVTMLLVKIQSLIFVIYMFAGHIHL